MSPLSYHIGLIKRKGFLLLLAALAFSFGNKLGAQDFSPLTIDKIISSENHFNKTTDTDPIHLAHTSNYDVVYHRLQLSINPAVRAISGSVTTYFKPLVSIDTIAFDLSDSLTVSAVNFHGTAVTSFRHANDQLSIALPAAITSLDSISVMYGGVPPTTGFGSFVQNFHGDSVPVIWTLSEPYGARDWWPCKNSLQDKVDSIDTYISVPPGNMAAGNGLLVQTIFNSPGLTYHWKHRYPIATYLVATAVTNYSQFTDTLHTDAGNVVSINFCYPENATEWKTATPNTEACMALYTHLFGPYPFIKEKYGHAQFSWGGGEEHQTMSFQVNLSFELDAHEMAHQWFGDKLTCNSWSDIWLNEGFATYCSGLCYENLGHIYWRPFLETRRYAAMREPAGSVFCDDTNSLARIFNGDLSYSKGAYLLHMLRWVCGEQQFFAGIHNYINDPALVYQFSKTNSLKNHLAKSSGKNLDAFFKNWYEGKGYPSYQLAWQKNGADLKMRLLQSTSDASVPFFEMPVPIRVYSGSAKTDFVLNNSFSGQEFSEKFEGTIDSILIDPDLWILSKDNAVKKVAAIDKPFVVPLPDPFHSQLTLWYDSENIHDAIYRISDLQGRKVLQGNVNSTGPYFIINTENLQEGVYTLQFVSNELRTSMKIVKE